MKTKGYQERLIDFADYMRGDPFEWGANDCVALTLACMSIMSEDEDHRLLSTWEDAPSARKTLKVLTPEGYLEKVGAVQVPMSTVITGDILTGMRDRLPTVHVVVGRNIFTSWLDEGVNLTPIDYDEMEGLTAWRLP